MPAPDRSSDLDAIRDGIEVANRGDIDALLALFDSESRGARAG
jgi:hypothetical protein